MGGHVTCASDGWCRIGDVAIRRYGETAPPNRQTANHAARPRGAASGARCSAARACAQSCRRAAEAARCRRRNLARRDRSPDAAPRGGHAAASPPSPSPPSTRSQILITRSRARAPHAAESPYLAIGHCFCRGDESTILPIKKQRADQTTAGRHARYEENTAPYAPAADQHAWPGRAFAVPPNDNQPTRIHCFSAARLRVASRAGAACGLHVDARGDPAQDGLDAQRSRRFLYLRLPARADGRREGSRDGRRRARQHAAPRAGAARAGRREPAARERRHARFDRVARRCRRAGDRRAARRARPLSRRARARHVDQRAVVDRPVGESALGREPRARSRSSARAGRARCRKA